MARGKKVEVKVASTCMAESYICDKCKVEFQPIITLAWFESSSFDDVAAIVQVETKPPIGWRNFCGLWNGYQHLCDKCWEELEKFFKTPPLYRKEEPKLDAIAIIKSERNKDG